VFTDNILCFALVSTFDNKADRKVRDISFAVAGVPDDIEGLVAVKVLHETTSFFHALRSFFFRLSLKGREEGRVGLRTPCII
jgi:hypothetical protein